MESYMSGLFALCGTLLGIIGTVAAQFITQRNENARNLRKLAYEAAMTEWRERALTARKGLLTDSEPGKTIPVPLPELFILNHLAWIEHVESAGGAGKFGVADYERFLRDREVAIARMYSLHGELKKEYARDL